MTMARRATDRMAMTNISELGMYYQFNTEEWGRMGSAERVQRCRLFAHEAHALAASADPNMERPYLDIAHDWEKLAEDIEAETGRARLLVTGSEDVLR